MEIDLQTRIGDMLEAYPGLEDALYGMSPAFAKLKNPVLRRTVARVATVGQAAKMAGIPPASMVAALRRAAGLSAETAAEDMEEGADVVGVRDEGTDRPGWLDESKIAVRYDAGAVIDAGGSPLADVLRLADGLEKGALLEVAVPFKPQPLMDMLKSKGFRVWYDGKCYIAR